MTKATWQRMRRHFIWQPITLSREVREITWKQELMQSPWKNAVYWLVPHDMLSLLPQSTQDHSPRDGTGRTSQVNFANCFSVQNRQLFSHADMEWQTSMKNQPPNQKTSHSRRMCSPAHLHFWESLLSHFERLLGSDTKCIDCLTLCFASFFFLFFQDNVSVFSPGWPVWPIRSSACRVSTSWVLRLQHGPATPSWLTTRLCAYKHNLQRFWKISILILFFLITNIYLLHVKHSWKPQI